MDKAIKWKSSHPKGYRIVLDRCFSELDRGNNKIFLSALLFELVRDSKIVIDAGMGNSLAFLIQKDFPEFKDKFHIRRAVSVRDEKTEILNMLQKMMSL